MTSAIAKLRKEFKKHNEEMRNFKTERVAVKHDIPTMKNEIVDEIIKNKKMTVDQEKLEKTIQKAVIPIKKKEIVVIDFVPVVNTHVPEPKVVEICKALNLNGTPCKCRAKIGKFCAKHAV